MTTSKIVATKGQLSGSKGGSSPPLLSYDFYYKGLNMTTLSFVIALIIRAALIVFSEWQDENMLVKYTDIDYVVYTDASRFVVEGLSPYDRSTYRYTPLLAYLLVPNILVHKAFGKVLFVVCDMIIGYLLKWCLMLRFPKINPFLLFVCTSAWLFNPFAINVSTRGNAESVIGAMVLAAVYFLFKKKLILASLFYGLSVHFKIYPIIYSIPMYLYIDSNYYHKNPSKYSSQDKSISYKQILRNLFTKNRLIFFLASASTFLILTFAMYLIYGYVFLFETYLYHVVRADNRHNFSVYFYQIYLNTPIIESVTEMLASKSAGLSLASLGVSLASFLPQVVLLLAISVVYFNDLEFCMLLETITFVAFNKVCTVQYFIWYFSLLPLVLPATSLSLMQGIIMFAFWMGSQGAWLGSAFQLEFLGQQTFFNIWLSGIAFFAANIFMLGYADKGLNNNNNNNNDFYLCVISGLFIF
ncbi:glycosyltransferase [Cavenderia fasciculata]|uniref:GPI mannosyltransferase 1 n=1 Tax=Cavenderia fasciculata TaxID=261658 RepID=F4QEX9_CACFS|nr:glycosyltransferase [Cavenderia fasciculata]EGG14186.1 glycosyltransferase [Cavenderia fasciculata]|eukprot:XP_004350894.1 glycosyltransferase [Cavenderia fasciculata]